MIRLPQRQWSTIRRMEKQSRINKSQPLLWERTTNLRTFPSKVRQIDGSATVFLRRALLYSKHDADICTPKDWAEEDTEDPGANQHLWEESWDDDDTSDDFAKQLK